MTSDAETTIEELGATPSCARVLLECMQRKLVGQLNTAQAIQIVEIELIERHYSPKAIIKILGNLFGRMAATQHVERN